jgi:hypothetical protein
MFTGEDDASAAGCFENSANGAGVERGGIEDGRIFITLAPFLAGEGVHGEVQEVVEAQLGPAELALRGQRAIGRGRRGRAGERA